MQSPEQSPAICDRPTQQRLPNYYCQGPGDLVDGRGTRHMNTGGQAIDAAVASAFLAALASAALQACLIAARQLEDATMPPSGSGAARPSKPAATLPGPNLSGSDRFHWPEGSLRRKGRHVIHDFPGHRLNFMRPADKIAAIQQVTNPAPHCIPSVTNCLTQPAHCSGRRVRPGSDSGKCNRLNATSLRHVAHLP